MGQMINKYFSEKKTGELFIINYEYKENNFIVFLENDLYKVSVLFKEHPYHLLSSLQNLYLYNDFGVINTNETNFYIIENSELILYFETNNTESEKIYHTGKIHFLIYTVDICLDIITDDIPIVFIASKR